jgi:hypothetical protein
MLLRLKMVNCTERRGCMVPAAYQMTVKRSNHSVFSHCMYAARTLYDMSYFCVKDLFKSLTFYGNKQVLINTFCNSQHVLRSLFVISSVDKKRYNKLATFCQKRSKCRRASLSFTARIFKTKRGTRGWDDKFSRYNPVGLHCKKRISSFPSPAGISLTKLFLARNNLIIPGQGEFGLWKLGWGREKR